MALNFLPNPQKLNYLGNLNRIFHCISHEPVWMTITLGLYIKDCIWLCNFFLLPLFFQAIDPSITKLKGWVFMIMMLTLPEVQVKFAFESLSNASLSHPVEVVVVVEVVVSFWDNPNPNCQLLFQTRYRQFLNPLCESNKM